MHKLRGFTLVETIIVLAIFAVIGLIMTALFISHSNLYRIESSTAGIKTQKALFIKSFRETAEAASAVTTSATIGGALYTSSSSTAVFKLPSIDESRDIISGKFDYVVFYKTGNNLFIETDADETSQRKDLKRKLSDLADNLIFRYDSSTPSSASLVTASLRLKNSSLFQEEISSSASLRNK